MLGSTAFFGDRSERALNPRRLGERRRDGVASAHFIRDFLKAAGRCVSAGGIILPVGGESLQIAPRRCHQYCLQHFGKAHSALELLHKGPPTRRDVGQGRRVAQDRSELAGKRGDVVHVSDGDTAEAARQPLMAR